jgi:putative nucleotidyltransferase with HDIG domain
MALEYVASGNFRVTKRGDIRLKVLLGSNVGVAIFDKKSGVGGIYNILLPNPITHSEGFQPFVFAESGLPKFINKLEELGAKKKNMCAVLAGGALVAPITPMDLDMNIGGRIVDMAQKILYEKDITVEASETGGYFSCSLTLNMENFSYSISPVGKEPKKNTAKSFAIDQQAIWDSMGKVRPIPQIALKAIQMINSDQYNMSQLSAEIQKDQVATARVISLSNSAYFNTTGKEIDSLQKAISLLGEKRLLQTVLNTCIELFFNNVTYGYSLTKGGLFHHANTVAMCSEKIAAVSGREDPSIAYTAGLIHDIGKTVLDQFIAGEAPYFYREIIENGRSLIEVEKEIFSIDHTQIGTQLAEAWKFPLNLKNVIRHHHNPKNATEDRILIYVVHLADFLTSRFNLDLELNTMDSADLGECLSVLKLNKSDIEKILNTVTWNNMGFGAL